MDKKEDGLAISFLRLAFHLAIDVKVHIAFLGPIFFFDNLITHANLLFVSCALKRRDSSVCQWVQW